MYETKYRIGRFTTKRTVYEKSNLHSKGGNLRTSTVFQGEYSIKNYRQRQKIRKNTVMELVENNFTAGSKFITLTFDEVNKTVVNEEGWESKYRRFNDVKDCNAEFKQFIQRLKYRFNNLKYVAVIELQNKNNRNIFHYHMICNLPYIEVRELCRIWGNGFVHIENVYDLEGLSEYMTKDMLNQTEYVFKGNKGYLCSRGLQRNIVVRSWSTDPEEKKLYQDTRDRLNNKIATLDYKCTNQYAGTFEYSMFLVQ